ncbi:hypothetical protein NJC40_03205 [Pseudomonas sp. 21LCFQ02]|uniref:hypothetical protein n=1 Tax=Pseudomonas sp. 21LCFQ02 TaxID=2957505 RepID=UPI00209A8F0A|nr:hypothetical protein [Pseudomonas sp. 21LCFQ02]MCO8166785.1 hypothetical protein [Pseudomonas sp. 21LCFQ02]
MTSSTAATSNTQAADRLPLGSLLALAGFITILTEALPAGLLLERVGTGSFAPAMLGLLLITLVAAWPRRDGY